MPADPAFNTLAQMLQQMGLGDLFTIGPDGSPGGWLMDQLRSGVDTEDELGFAIQQTDAFRNEYGVIVEQQRRAAAGQPVYVMSPSEVQEYRQRARQIMSASAMPTWFYDTKDDFDQLMLKDVSLQELEKKVVISDDFAANAPQEVKDMFNEYYGVQGQAALTAYVLDPERTMAQIERAQRVAYTGGMAKRYDIQLNQDMANQLADTQLSQQGIEQGLQQVASQQSIFAESPFERENLTAEDTGIKSVFEGDALAKRAIERRVTTRSAPSQGSGGGAVLTNAGLQGAASAGGG